MIVNGCVLADESLLVLGMCERVYSSKYNAVVPSACLSLFTNVVTTNILTVLMCLYMRCCLYFRLSYEVNIFRPPI